MNLSEYITGHMEQILAEWEAFAGTFGAVTRQMSSAELRDHAREILEFVASDIQRPESALEAEQTTLGLGARPARSDSASSTHGRLRFASGFTLLQLIAEYRALRASVLKLWLVQLPERNAQQSREVMRFNEAIDQSLSDAVVAYSEKVATTRDMFLAILGHDLRGPLAATAAGGAYLALPGAFDDRVQQIGVRIKRSAATMSAMVNDLLGLARTQLGDGIPIERQQCDLLEMCQWVLDDVRAAHPQARIELTAMGELIGQFDRPRLQQLLTNLANNAVQYGVAGAPIVIDATGEPERVVFTVSNHGPSIPAQALPCLFDSLVQLPQEAGHVRPRSSLGLGLYIAKKIALAHGGTIGVRSEHDTTAFRVEVPRH